MASVSDGPEEPGQYVWMASGAAGGAQGPAGWLDAPAVTVAVAKKPGTNAVELVRDLDARIASAARVR